MLSSTQTELDQLIEKAYLSNGAEIEVNKVYTTFLRSNVYIPIELYNKPENSLAKSIDEEEPFKPLFLQHDAFIFMLCFDTLDRLKAWAGQHWEKMGYVSLLGRDLIRSIGMKIHLSLNYDTPYYKEFSPEEIENLKQVVGRLDRMALKAKK